MRLHPPEILITTPESLNILLASAAVKELFHSLSTVILDEIHSVIESKSGTHLISAVERLTGYAGEFQRIALSATVKPASLIARFVGGFRVKPAVAPVSYQERPVEILEDTSQKKYDLSVITPSIRETNEKDDTWWTPLISKCLSIINKNRSTLFFVGSRKKTEKIARLINEAAGRIIAYSHHGALAKEIRLAVEDFLKSGRLKAIVATGTLELGIDIGALDEVVLIQSPHSVSQTVQRIGRAGHDVSGTSRSTLIPLDGIDFLHLGTLAKAVTEHAIESITPIEAPLDVLAQIILSMTVTEAWKIDELYRFLTSIFPGIRSTPFWACLPVAIRKPGSGNCSRAWSSTNWTERSARGRGADSFSTVRAA